MLGFAGAFFDAAGGGGYGPIVTGSLMASRNEPKKAIGTVNSSEFFVTLASSITFFILVSDIGRYIPVIAGLIIGGVIAAPIAAKLCMKANEKLLYAGTGALLMFLNICNIINYFQV